MSLDFVVYAVVAALNSCDTACSKIIDLSFSSIRVASETPTASTQPQSQQNSIE
jgi:hypothetical protein